MTILYLTFTSVGNYVTLSYFAPMTSLHNSISASVLCNWLWQRRAAGCVNQ